MRTKRCNGCQEKKPLSGFYAAHKNADGLQAKCKECRKAQIRRARERNIEHYREYERKRNQTEERKAWYREREQTPQRKALYQRLRAKGAS